MIVAAGTLLVVLVTRLIATGAARKKTPNGAAVVKASKPSPKKKDFTKIQITQDDMKQTRKLAYYMKIIKLRCDFELIWIDSTPNNDGYGQKLFDYITVEQGFKSEGILMVVRRRKNQQDNTVLTNANDKYPRRCILRMVDESTTESRLAILHALQAYLIRPEHNKYKYEYVVNDASDLTPPNESDYEPMDHYLQDATIVNLMTLVFEDANDSWFANNRECAFDFFSGPSFPKYAIERLGYPSNDIPMKSIEPGFPDFAHEKNLV
jgi:hypothetical protein